MSILIIESCEKVIDPKSPSSIVHVKNSEIIAKHIGADLVSHQSQIQSVMHKKYDAIICAYGSPYMKYNAYLEILDENKDAKMFWLVNDHDVEDNILLRKWVIKHNKPYHMICNNPRSGYRSWILNKKMNDKKLNDWIDEWYTVNLNVMIFDENLFNKTMQTSERSNDVLYYGTFRKHRIKDMLDYNNVGYFISSSKKNHLKYQESGINAKFIEKLQWFDKEPDLIEPFGLRLRDYKYSIYFEDEHTHSNYAFMANRFYECVMNNTLLFYDARCKLIIEKSGYKIDSYQIVKNGDELKEKIAILADDEYKTLLEIQQSNFQKIMDEKKDVLQIIKNITSNQFTQHQG
jgi:hypothetical protein